MANPAVPHFKDMKLCVDLQNPDPSKIHHVTCSFGNILCRQTALANCVHKGNNYRLGPMVCFAARGKRGLYRTIMGVIVVILAVGVVSITSQAR